MYPKSVIAILILVLIMLSACGNDGTLLALGGSFEGGGIALFDPATPEIVAEIGNQRQIARELRFSPDGGVLFSIGNDNFVRVWGLSD